MFIPNLQDYEVWFVEEEDKVNYAQMLRLVRLQDGWRPMRKRCMRALYVCLPLTICPLYSLFG